MPEDSVLFRFWERDSREGITRVTLKRLPAALDLSESPFDEPSAGARKSVACSRGR